MVHANRLATLDKTRAEDKPQFHSLLIDPRTLNQLIRNVGSVSRASMNNELIHSRATSLFMGDLNKVTWDTSSSHVVFLVVCVLSTIVIDQISHQAPQVMFMFGAGAGCGLVWLVVFICLGCGPWVKGW